MKRMKCSIVSAVVLVIALQLSAQSAQSKWLPPDRKPFGYFWSNNRIAVEYQFRIEFFSFPSNYKVETDGPMRVKVGRTKDSGFESVNLTEQKPIKVLRFRRRFTALNRMAGEQSGPYILICSNAMSSHYTPANQEEMSAAGGDSRGPDWLAPRFDLDDFCGIVGLDGTVLYRFPISQHPPDTLAKPIFLDRDGTAAVAVGREASYQSEDGSSSVVGGFREALIWKPGEPVNRRRFQRPMKGVYEVYQEIKSRK